MPTSETPSRPRLRVVLYNPKAVFFTMPLGLLSVASHLPRERYEVELVDGRLEADPGDSDLLREMRNLGMRRTPFFPFLKRSNPINKYAGMLRSNSRTSPSSRR